jgi:hypothetical protein
MRQRTTLLIGGAALVLLIARIVWAIMAWSPGTSPLMTDDYDRVQLAVAWAESPFVFPARLIWLPLHTWVTGLALVVFGTGSPMAVAAAVNTAAMIGASALLGLAAFRIYRSAWWGLATAAIFAFNPWTLHLSLSGLSEPLLFLAIAGTVFSTIVYSQTGRIGHLIAAAASGVAAALTRYEGWWLLIAWSIVVAALLLRSDRRRDLRWLLPRVVVAFAPFFVPALWLLMNAIEHGDPLFFSAEVREHLFRFHQVRTIGGLRTRVGYYPSALIETGGVLLVLGLGGLAASRRKVEVWLVTGLGALFFGLFWVWSVASDAVGLYPERFMLGFAIPFVPLIGGLGVLVERLRAPAPRWVAVTATVVVVAAVQMALGSDRSTLDEWSLDPDFVVVADAMSALEGGEILVGGAGVAGFDSVLDMRLGDRYRRASDIDEADVWLEVRPPQDLRGDDVIVVGRYLLGGARVREIEVEPCIGCTGWEFQDEAGNRVPAVASPFLSLRFAQDNPGVGAQASLVKTVPRSAMPQAADLRLRFGAHGFYQDLVAVEVRVDDEPVFRRDVQAPMGWFTIPIDIPAGVGLTTVSVHVVTLPQIEIGWTWGWGTWGSRTVLVESFVVDG